MHKKIAKVQEILERELCGMLDQIAAAGSISPTEVDTMDDAVELMLKMQKLEERLEYDDESYGPSYDNYNGGSYRRGRDVNTGRYVSRDSYRGPYYNDGYMRDSYRGGNGGYYDRGSFERGYSGHSIKDRMVSQLEAMYDEAQTEHERQMVDEWIKRIETEQQ